MSIEASTTFTVMRAATMPDIFTGKVRRGEARERRREKATKRGEEKVVPTEWCGRM
jgi:hypothetical protein